jgi:hypothetical protein
MNRSPIPDACLLGRFDMHARLNINLKTEPQRELLNPWDRERSAKLS